nr:MAG TPA: hypothetical protein [Caudoviricetes sp.]
MHIISKEKDSYDYLVGKWGVDKNITLDRTSFDNSFSKAICEMEHCKACYISPKSGVYIHHYLLKVGYKYFLVRSIEDYDHFTINMEVISSFECFDKRIEGDDSIISLYSVSPPLEQLFMLKTSGISWDEYITSVTDDALNKLSFYRLNTNFFLGKNGFGFLDQEEVYLAIYSYLSSLKKDKDSSQSNDGKIVSHGFDKKKSFRNMKR